MESYPRMEKLTHSLSRQFPSPTPYVTQNKVKESMYKPEVQSAVAAQVMCKRQLAKHHHDQSAKQLPSLVLLGQPVPVNAHP